MASSAFVFLVFPLFIGSKSESETGSVSVLFFVAVFLAVVFVYCVLLKFSFKGVYKEFLYLFFYFFSLILLSSFILGGAQSKRVSMFALVLMIVPIVYLVENNIKQKRIARILVLISLVSPTLIFESSRAMLLTNGL